MTTKAQEKEALEKIKRIMDHLEEDSYIKIAFEGCLEDAESNILYDYADSMKKRWDSAEAKVLAGQRKIAELQDKLVESEKDYEAAHAVAHQIADEKDEEIVALKSRLLADDDLADISRLLSKKVLDLGKEVSNAAERIVEGADQPESAAFRNAVKDHRAAKADLSLWNKILSKVNSKIK